MSVLQFVASMAGSLAWPVVALVAVIVFRRELGPLLARLEHLRAFSVEAQFVRQMADLKPVVASEGVPADERRAAAGPADDALAEVARVAPAVAVVDAYARVEDALRRRLARAGVTRTYQTDAMTLARMAAGKNLLPPQTVQGFYGLATLRNLAIHGGDRELSPGQAMEYLALADAVLYALEGLDGPAPTAPAPPPAGDVR